MFMLDSHIVDSFLYLHSLLSLFPFLSSLTRSTLQIKVKSVSLILKIQTASEHVKSVIGALTLQPMKP